MKELTYNELLLIDGGFKFSQACFFVAGVAACFVTPYIAVPMFVMTFDYSAS